MPAILVDTNILLYAYDVRDVDKQLRAQDVLARLYDTQSGVMSVQALAEFMNSARKIGITQRMLSDMLVGSPKHGALLI